MTTDNDLPLSGIRVLDLGQVYAGPTCARVLCDLGAEVIKIEGINRTDPIRNLFIADNDGRDDYWNRGAYYVFRNVGKRSITLELTTSQGVELFKRLVPLADVIVESFTPRVMRNLGLDYESLRQLRPDIIMISLSGYGQSGPWRDFGAYGTGLEAASGICSITGYCDGPPARTGISFTDPVTGLTGAGAVLLALHYRRCTGRGQFIDLSQHEAAIPLIGHALMDFVMNNRQQPRRGNRDLVAAPQGCYRCRGDDDWLVISVTNDSQWLRFAEAIGHPEWAQDERFADVLSRHRHHDELDALIETWTQEQDHIEAMHLLQRAGVTAAAVLNPKEVLLDPHLRERGAFDLEDVPGAGKRPVPRVLGARFSRFDAGARGPAPKLGEHNREVLQGLLGLSEEEVTRLEEEGVIGTEPVLAWPLPIARQFVVQPLVSFKQIGAVLDMEPDFKEQLGLEGGGDGPGPSR
jgi:crotonobetainyl-CoA:carnitine CoA-transferase CaiB-like acyl-CoA transferase